VRALAHRAVAMQRWCVRRAEKLQKDRACEISAELLSLRSEPPAFKWPKYWGPYRVDYERRRGEGEARPNTVSARLQRVRDGLVGRFRRVARMERSEDPLAQYLNSESESTYFKRVGGRFLYVLVTDLPVIREVPRLITTGGDLLRGFCPCGQHVLDYGVCAYFWERLTVHAIDYIRELLTYAATNGDYATVALQVVNEAREVFYRGERGRKLARKTLRKTIMSKTPYVKLAQWSFGLASDAAYVLSGTGLDVAARLQALEEWGLRPIHMEDVDQIGYLLLEAERCPDVATRDLDFICTHLPTLVGGTREVWREYYLRATLPDQQLLTLTTAPKPISKWWVQRGILPADSEQVTAQPSFSPLRPLSTTYGSGLTAGPMNRPPPAQGGGKWWLRL
jgi:hypothetical protein